MQCGEGARGGVAASFASLIDPPSLRTPQFAVGMAALGQIFLR